MLSTNLPPIIKDTVMSQEQFNLLIDCYAEVLDIFQDKQKAVAWFTTKNPNLGEIAPVNFFLVGRGQKVVSFIRDAREENDPREV